MTWTDRLSRATLAGIVRLRTYVVAAILALLAGAYYAGGSNGLTNGVVLLALPVAAAIALIIGTAIFWLPVLVFVALVVFVWRRASAR